MTIRNECDNLKSALETAKIHAEQDYIKLRISARSMTEDELFRSDALEKSLGYIEEALLTIEQNEKRRKAAG